MASFIPSVIATASAFGVLSVTPSDSVDLTYAVRAIRVTVGGTVKITCGDGTTVTCAFTDGETRAITATRIWATGTTSTGIEGMY